MLYLGVDFVIRSEIQGLYTIGCHPSVAIYSLPFFLPSLLKTYPKIEIQLEHDLSRKITESVISFKVDMSIVINPVSHPDLVIKELGTDSVTLWKNKGCSPPNVLICDPDQIQSQ